MKIVEENKKMFYEKEKELYGQQMYAKRDEVVKGS